MPFDALSSVLPLAVGTDIYFFGARHAMSLIERFKQKKTKKKPTSKHPPACKLRAD